MMPVLAQQLEPGDSVFAHPPEFGRFYTTNAIESLNMSLRKVTKARGSFPNDEEFRTAHWRCATLARSGPCRSMPGRMRSIASPHYENRLPAS